MKINFFVFHLSRFQVQINLIGFILIIIGLFSCSHEPVKVPVNKDVQRDTIQKEFVFIEKKDTSIQSGEYIKYYKNKAIEMRGSLKNGEREGVWKSYYEDGSPWSETTFSIGKKNGKTSSWYMNKKKRYEGFYNNELESGKWIFWDETGKVKDTKNY